MNILLTGGTGFIGRNLCALLLKDGHTLTILTRERRANTRNISYLVWNGHEMPLGMGFFDVVVNLAGLSLAEGKWTDEHKQKILDSRVAATQACVSFINKSSRPPQVFVSTSAVGFYGGYREETVTETATPGTDFMADVCQKWEEAAAGATCRTVVMRIGVVLGREGGALPKMALAYKAFLGGNFAGGEQGFPWIHIQDVVGAMRWAINTPEAHGVYNLTGPEALTQQQFSHTLAKAVHRPAFMPVPKFALEWLMGEQSILLWGGQKAISDKLVAAGYEFQYKTAADALKNLV